MREYLRHERFAAEAIKAERDAAIRNALKMNMPIFEVAKEFGLTDAEIGEIIKNQGPPRRDALDLKDSHDEKRQLILPPERR